MLDIPDNSIILESVITIKYMDPQGREQISSYYGADDGSETDYAEVLKLLEATRFSVYAEIMAEMFLDD